MATERHSDEQELKMLREIEVHLQDSNGVMSACRNAGISGNTYDYWRKKFGGLSWSQLSEMMAILGTRHGKTAVRGSLNRCEQANGSKLLAKKLKPFGRAQLQAMTRN